jgi:hypothetical protein
MSEGHDPTYMRGGGACWAFCSCGWTSPTYVAMVGAQLAFGDHLLASRPAATNTTNNEGEHRG